VLNSSEISQPLTALSNSTAVRLLQVLYQDSLGNTSAWITMGRIRYYETARDIWAIHNPTESSTAGDFFYQGAPLSRDRRLRRTQEHPSVTLFFYISSTASASLPDMVRIAEIDFAALQGSDSNRLIRERDFPITAMTAQAGANNAYMSGKPSTSSATYYRVTYNWNVTYPASSGIIRLAVMPYRNGETLLDTWQAAVDEGRFVTVVFDNQAPGGFSNFSLSGEDSRNGSLYIFNPNANTLNITANFSGIADNSGVGIPFLAATQDKPWTMDERSAIQWQFRIVNENAPATELITPSSWYSINTNEVTRNLTTAPALPGSPVDTRTIQVQYRDSLGNTSGWLSTNQNFRYDTTNLSQVSTWSASYHDASNVIDLTWTLPANALRIEVWVNGFLHGTGADTSGSSYRILDIPRANSTGIRSGQPTSNVMEYNISLITVYSNDGRSEPRTFKIWNIPGMSVNQSNTVTEIRTQDELANVANNLSGQFVLANNIEINGAWTPIGISDTNSFTGKFYGNGHTITVSGGFGGTTYRGIFGYAQNAVIRDLTLNYNHASPINVPANSYIGGIVGYLSNTRVSNVITTGGTLSVISSGAVWLGGITGYIRGSQKIENSRAGLSVSLTNNGSGHEAISHIGAVAGETGTGTGTDADHSFTMNNGFSSPNPTLQGLILDGLTVVANVNANARTSGTLNIGGAVGSSIENTLRDISVNGEISFLKNTNSVNNCGGIIGRAHSTNLVNSFFSGSVGTTGGVTVSGNTELGGLIGSYRSTGGRSSFINNCQVRGNVIFNGSYSYIGGVIGYSNNIAGGASITITNTYLMEGDIGVIGVIGPVRAGGFGGDFTNTHLLNNSGTLGGRVSVEAAANTTSSVSVFVGGFTSLFSSGNISNCFANTNVDVRADTTIYAGGFIGRNGGNITSCYATGTVSVVYNAPTGSIATRPHVLRVGGFVGYNATEYWAGTIRNSYSTGDVFADRTASEHALEITEAGGFVGRLAFYSTSSPGIIEHCFSLGEVIALSAQSQAYAGGLVGFVGSVRDNETGPARISNTVVLGDRNRGVATGPAGTSAGRVWGGADGTFAPVNNHAINSRLVGTGIYNAHVAGNTVSGMADNLNGANIGLSQTRSRSFWETTLGFNTSIWDFSTVVGRGYPVLRGLSGQ
jgi:hypothetical protein